MPETDHVLGNHDDDIARLGLQHRVWRDAVTAAWQRAEIRERWQVLDVGAGSGHALADLG